MEKIYVIVRENMDEIEENMIMMGYTSSKHEAEEIIRALEAQITLSDFIYYYEEVNKINVV